MLGGFLFRIGVGAIPFLLPLMLQLGFGLNPLQSGSLTFMAAAGALFTKTIAKRILQLFGFRRLLTVNAFVGSAFIAANGLFSPATPLLADHGGAVPRRLLPLAPVHEPQRHRLCRRVEPRHELRHEPLGRCRSSFAQRRGRARRLRAREPRPAGAVAVRSRPTISRPPSGSWRRVSALSGSSSSPG